MMEHITNTEQAIAAETKAVHAEGTLESRSFFYFEEIAERLHQVGAALSIINSDMNYDRGTIESALMLVSREVENLKRLADICALDAKKETSADK